MKRVPILSSAVLILALAACGPPASDSDAGVVGPCVPDLDDDMDGIRNALEGCQEDPPRDSDGDRAPDYLDLDSDGDGVQDRYEDRNGDGIVGECTTTCASAADCDPTYYCALPESGVGNGACIAPECLKGETDPRAKDSDGDGDPDSEEGGWVCNPTSETNPFGRKNFTIIDSAASQFPSANWQVAVEIDTLDGPATIENQQPLESGYLFDLPGSSTAGFLVSRALVAGETDATVSATLAMQRIVQLTSNPVADSQIRTAGTRNTSLDGFDTILGSTVLLTIPSAKSPGAFRGEVMKALMGAPRAVDMVVPDVAWLGTTSTSIAISFQTIHRTADGQILFVGAVTAAADLDDVNKQTRFNSDDLSNGTGVTYSPNGLADECENFRVGKVPKADIIWVIDESGSMSGDRTNVSNNSTFFFDSAVQQGLDFRMGVTDMNDTNLGRFAYRSSAASDDDKWILPSELALFKQYVLDPSGPGTADGGSEHGLTQGRAAMSRHLPRSDSNPQKIRTDAKLVVIYVTDEHPDEIEPGAADIIAEGNAIATPEQRVAIRTYMDQFVTDFTMNNAVAHVLGIAENSCSGEPAYGYMDLVDITGGVFGDICQPDLGATVDAIIDDITGSASPVKLAFVPISLSIAVARENNFLPRSRALGWGYRENSNTIVFYNQVFDPNMPSDIVVSYRRWEEQVIPL